MKTRFLEFADLPDPFKPSHTCILFKCIYENVWNLNKWHQLVPIDFLPIKMKNAPNSLLFAKKNRIHKIFSSVKFTVCLSSQKQTISILKCFIMCRIWEQRDSQGKEEKTRFMEEFKHLISSWQFRMEITWNDRLSISNYLYVMWLNDFWISLFHSLVNDFPVLRTENKRFGQFISAVDLHFQMKRMTFMQIIFSSASLPSDISVIWFLFQLQWQAKLLLRFL